MLKKKMMEEKISKRKLLTEEITRKSEETSKAARARREEFASGRMDKLLKKSILAADVSLAATAVEDTSGDIHGKESDNGNDCLSVDDGEAVGNEDEKEVSEVLSRPVKQTKKPIRIGRRTITIKKVAETEVSKSETVQIPKSIDRISTENEGNLVRVVEEDIEDSPLYPMRRSPPRSNSIGSDHAESKTVKGKNAKLKNGRKKHNDLQSVEEVSTVNVVEVSNIKGKVKTLKSKASLNPPDMNDESSLMDKLDKRRRHIDRTLQNPEEAISASKLVKKVDSPMEETSLQKKLSRQRMIVEEASENPTPVKSIVRRSKRRKSVTEEVPNALEEQEIVKKCSPPKKMKTVTQKKSTLKKSIELPKVQDGSPLMANKLDNRKKKMKEAIDEDELSFENKFPKNVSEVKSIETASKLVKRKKVVKSQEDAKQDEAQTSALVNDTKSTRVVKDNHLKVKKKVSKDSRHSSEEQEYFTAAEESLSVPRPRRNCKKKFSNLEGLASSTPSPVIGAEVSETERFQFPDSTAAAAAAAAEQIDSKSEIIEEKAVKKKYARKTGKLMKAAAEEVDTATVPSSVEVVVHSPTESANKPAPKKAARKPRKNNASKEASNTATEQTDDDEKSRGIASKSVEAVKPGKKSKTTSSARTSAKARGALGVADDEIYKTPSSKIPDEVYQTPKPLGSFSSVVDEEYETPAETVRKPRRKQKK